MNFNECYVIYTQMNYEYISNPFVFHKFNISILLCSIDDLSEEWYISITA